MVQLRRDLRGSRLAAYSDGTTKNLKTQWKAYLLFCSYFQFKPLPATSEMLCLYAQFLSRSITPNSIRNYLNGVRLFHLYNGFEFSLLQDFSVRITLTGIARIASHTPKQALAITVQILFAVASVVDFSDASEVTILCVAIFAFFLFARLSSLLPKSTCSFDYKLDLCRRSIFMKKGLLVVAFRRSKTIQFGERILSIPLIPIPSSLLCPVSIHSKMVSMIPAHSKSPAFLHIVRGKPVPLTKAVFINKFRLLLGRANVPLANLYTGHSFRRGGATWAFGIGVPGELIQTLGDWRSECYKRYFDFSLELMVKVGLCMREGILQYL